MAVETHESVSGRTQGEYSGPNANATAGSTGMGYEAKATASFETWNGTSGSAVGTPDDKVHTRTDYLTATAAAKAGAMTGLEAKANLVESRDQSGKITIGLDATTQVGYDANSESVKASFLGFGFSAGKEIGISTPLFSFSVTPWTWFS